jgi:hypothetical protein
VLHDEVLMITHFLNVFLCLFGEAVIFKVYDIDGKGKITFKDLLEVLRDLTGSFMSEEQREVLIIYLNWPCGFYTELCNISVRHIILTSCSKW